MMINLSLEKTTFYVSKALSMTKDELISSFQPAAIKDIPEILSLRQKTLSTKDQGEDERYLRWRYAFSSPDANCLWVCKKKGHILGIVGIEHVEIRVDGVQHSGARLMDIMVTPEKRGSGLGVWMNLALFEKYPFVYATGGNENSTNLLKKIFYTMPQGKNYIYPIKSKQLILSLKPQSRIAVKVLCQTIDKLIDLRNYIRKPASFDELTILKLPQFDKEVDKLYEAVSSEGLIFAKRDFASLNWRFVLNPKRYSILGCFLEKKLVAYCIFYIENETTAGPRKGRIVDWLALFPNAINTEKIPSGNKKNKMLINLLSWVFYHSILAMKKERVDWISVLVYDKNSEKALKNIGFILRPFTTGFYLKTANQNFHSSLIRSDKWFITGFDDDTV